MLIAMFHAMYERVTGQRKRLQVKSWSGALCAVFICASKNRENHVKRTFRSSMVDKQIGMLTHLSQLAERL